MRTVGLTFGNTAPEETKEDSKKKADWLAEAEELAIEVPAKATVADIKALIAEAAKAAAPEEDAPKEEAE